MLIKKYINYNSLATGPINKLNMGR
jgi:hypothetical protein